MTPRLQRLAWLALLATVFLPAGRPQPPRLVALLAVDQLRTDYLARFRTQYEGGLRWLLENGACFANAAYRHAATVTGAGHATLATGLHPATHGVVGNFWRESARGRVYCVEDERHAAVGGPGKGASPRALLAGTLGAALKSKHSGSKVYAFLAKDRAAILLAGHKADGALWYEPGCGCLLGSDYYGEALPEWLAQFNAGQSAAEYAGREWTPLLEDEELYEKLARKDDFPTEWNGVDTVFPHCLPREGFESELASTPYSDEITLEAALAALRSGEIGADSEPDLLALGLSATDSIGHRSGPFSQEAMDHHLRFDRMLGAFFDAIDELVGLDFVVVALSADHGAIPLVEELRARGIQAERFDSRALWERARKAIEACGSGSASGLVAQASGTQLYWSEEALRERRMSRGAISDCLARWLRQQPGLKGVFTSEQLAARGGDGVAVLFENAFFERRSAHVQVHLREFLYSGEPRGAGHGGAHAYERRVPVLLSGSGIASGRYDGPAGPEDGAPSLGAILGLEMPLEHDTRVLSEALW